MKGVKNMKRRLDLDNEDDYSTEAVSISNKPKVVNNIDVHLHGPIGPLKKYQNLFTCLRSLEEDDDVTIWLNSPGGDLVTGLEIIQAMRDCQAPVTVVATGELHSMGSLIALGAERLHIGPYTTMLIHAASYGYGGKAPDLSKAVLHYDAQLRTLTMEFYEGFLSREEIEAVLEGKDFWFNSEEILRRLDLRQQYQKEKQEMLEKGLQKKPRVVRKKKNPTDTQVD